MTTIKLSDFTKEAASKTKGLELKLKLGDALKNGLDITVDFHGITRFASPFFNNSFSALAIEYGFEAIQDITLVDLSPVGKETFDTSLQNAQIIANKPEYAEQISAIVNSIVPEGAE